MTHCYFARLFQNDLTNLLQAPKRKALFTKVDVTSQREEAFSALTNHTKASGPPGFRFQLNL